MLQNEISKSAMKNHLRLFSKSGEVDVDRTFDLAGVSFEQAVQIFEKKPFRKDKTPNPLFLNLVRQLAASLEFVAETFDGDVDKTRFWWLTPNASFGGLSPFELFTKRRYRTVFQFVLEARAKL